MKFILLEPEISLEITKVSDVETNTRREVLKPETASDMVVGVLGKPFSASSNLSPAERTAMKELQDNSLIVLPADKGRLTVVMDRNEYDCKVFSMLRDLQTYRELPRDPASGLRTKMNSLLLSLRRQGEIPDSLYYRLRSSSGTTPLLYGLPKVHKSGIPLRPIVSFCSSPTYRLSQHLCHILSPLVGNSDCNVKNSSSFANFICTQVLTNEVLVSFDVVSLFTKVPTGLAISVARKKLESDDSFSDRTALSVDNVIRLLSFCLDATYLSFRGKFYQQIYGTAMGSPVSVTVANMVMEHVEEEALSTFAVKPKFWKRYVDDTFTALPEDVVDSFHQHLNSVEPSIQFTVERESNGQLPFLDLLVTRDTDGSISTCVYRKPTHSDQYLHFSSHHPTSHKRSVVRTLLSRAATHSSSLVERSREESHVHRALLSNGYTEGFIQSCRRFQRNRSPEDLENPPIRICLPYFENQSQALKRILAPYNIRVSFRPFSTLRSVLSHPKDHTPLLSQSGVVYRVGCLGCDACYIGQTGRTLSQRLKEHQRAVENRDCQSNALAEHSSRTGHRIDWDGVTVLGRHSDQRQRCLLESWFIHQHHGHSINREQGLLPQPYIPLQLRRSPGGGAQRSTPSTRS